MRPRSTSVQPTSGPDAIPASTLLDTQDHPAPPTPEPPDPDWAYSAREAVARELEALTIDGEGWPRRVRALYDCGRAGIMVRCGECEAPHVVPFRCGARTCPSCAWRTAAAVSERLLARIAVHDIIMQNEPWRGQGPKQERRWRHVIMTTRADADRERRFDPGTLRENALQVRHAVSKFWRLTPWGRQVRDASGRRRSRPDTSYIVGQEIAPGGMVHVHMLVYGEFVRQDDLQHWWSDTIGETAFVWVRGVSMAEISKTIRYVLKYVTKGEKEDRDSARHAAAIELALRNIKRLSYGGAVRSVKIDPSDETDDDGRPEDLHDQTRLTCFSCGQVGNWIWDGIVRPDVIQRNGGYGLLWPEGPAVDERLEGRAADASR